MSYSIGEQGVRKWDRSNPKRTSIVAESDLLRSVDAIEFLDKGFSDERKYILSEGGDPIYLLRIGSIDNLLRRRRDFDLLRTHVTTGESAAPDLSSSASTNKAGSAIPCSATFLERAGQTRFLGSQFRPSTISGWMQAKSYGPCTS